MTEDSDCEVCGGDGLYPVIDCHCTELYSIKCPECFGSGKKYDDDVAEETGLPPRSTAASIKTDDDLLMWKAMERGSEE